MMTRWMTLLLLTLFCTFSVTAAADEKADDGKLRIIAFGAHPDDAEFQMGGSAIKWAKLGHHVKLVSVTNGDIGHWNMAGGPLAIRRTKEVQEAARRMGTTVEVLDIHDGELMPTLENRHQLPDSSVSGMPTLCLLTALTTTTPITATQASSFRMPRTWWLFRFSFPTQSR